MLTYINRCCQGRQPPRSYISRAGSAKLTRRRSAACAIAELHERFGSSREHCTRRRGEDRFGIYSGLAVERHRRRSGRRVGDRTGGSTRCAGLIGSIAADARSADRRHIRNRRAATLRSYGLPPLFLLSRFRVSRSTNGRPMHLGRRSRPQAMDGGFGKFASIDANRETSILTSRPMPRSSGADDAKPPCGDGRFGARECA